MSGPLWGWIGWRSGSHDSRHGPNRDRIERAGPDETREEDCQESSSGRPCVRYAAQVGVTIGLLIGGIAWSIKSDSLIPLIVTILALAFL